MNRLEEFANKIGRVGWSIKALLYVLEQVENAAECEEIELLVALIRVYLESVESDLLELAEQVEMYDRKMRT